MEIIGTLALAILVDSTIVIATVPNVAFNTLILAVGWCSLFVAPPFEEVEFGGHDGPTLSVLFLMLS